MELKTKIRAEPERKELLITREFELPVELFFMAYEDPEIVAQWMGTNVIQLENKKYGIWRFETRREGKVVFGANGVMLDLVPNKKITVLLRWKTVLFASVGIFGV